MLEQLETSAHGRPVPGSRSRPWLLAPLLALTLLASCGEERRPPAALTFDHLPVSGSLADARRAGFTACRPDNVTMRCRKEGVFLWRHGPFSAAVDLHGGDGAGGFDHLTLWHPTDQSALVAVTSELHNQGWSECLTPVGSSWAGQAIYQQKGSPIFVALDLSYWSIRRLTIYPARGTNIPGCRS